ncbi:hypothetical protein [Sphaerisporangium fuscum]|uniref:hypothetical protein n=1 Tax=Sphaerisporangium fuscum TaxID=2835868 RepID=UPI001BDD4715|nr:hypothetical protein [Sphaerisporangium fuscum]
MRLQVGDPPVLLAQPRGRLFAFGGDRPLHRLQLTGHPVAGRLGAAGVLFGLAAFTLVLRDQLPSLFLNALGLGPRLPGLLFRSGAPGPVPLRSAMHGWARVIFHPEPALALLDGGKRDFPYEEGLPEPQLVRGGGPLRGRPKVTALNDQHTFLRDAAVSVGDAVRLGLSHPCTAFDKWTLIPVLDDADAPTPA